MKEQQQKQAIGASETTRFFVPGFRLRRVPRTSYAQPEERSQTFAGQLFAVSPVQRGRILASAQPTKPTERRKPMDAKNLNSAMKGMKMKSWEIREDSTGKRRLYVRYIPAVPDIKTKGGSGKKRSA